MRKIFSIFLVCVAFYGCAYNQFQYKNLGFSQKSFEFIDNGNLYLLHISHKQNTYQFVLVDTLGSPIISKELRDGKFSDTKFLFPNSSYDEIFIDILNMIENSKSAKKWQIDNREIEVKEIEDSLL